MGIEIISGNANAEFKLTAFSQLKHTGDRVPVERLPGSGTGIALKEIVRNKVLLTDAIDSVKSAADFFNKRLDFRVDEETNRIVVKVIDTKTDKVIKEIPPEQLIELAAKIQEMVGLLIDEER